MAGLKAYHQKRHFGVTPEPKGAAVTRGGHAYVIQKHAARRLHYDLRLELDGVMKSWAVTRGPSLVPDDKRLSVHVEDHPVQYNTFEGTIPQGEYGGGTVMVWDRGEWRPEGDPHKGYKKGHLSFSLDGEKLHGLWHLVRMRKKPGEKHEPWLLIKSHDEFARTKKQKDILEEKPRSAVSGRSMEQIARSNGAVWHSNESVKANVARLAKTKMRTKGRDTKARTTAQPARLKEKPDAKPKAATSASKKPSKKPGEPSTALPDFIAPCLAKLVDNAPTDSSWTHEVKFDGYRMQARIDGDAITLLTRNGLDWTARFPRIAEALAQLPVHDAILDGEIVSENASGLSDFSQLQQDLKDRRHDRMVYYVFDILYLDGQDLRSRALEDRKKSLARLLKSSNGKGLVRLSESFDENGKVMQKHACELGLEGIVSKKKNAPYRSGRGFDWLKSKCSERQEFVVAGYTDSAASGRTLGSLILGYYDGRTFKYAGRIGTGFSQQSARALWTTLKKDQTAQCPFPSLPAEEKGARKPKWVTPRMVVEVAFRGWTHDGLLRHGSFQGLREDKPPREIGREEISRTTTTMTDAQKAPQPDRDSTKKGNAGSVSGSSIRLTHPDRLYWPDDGITKQQLAEFYVSIWDWMRPHVTGRVLSLLRCPEGQTKECFFQKHASAGIATEHLHLVKEPDGTKSISIESLDGLVSLVQSGVLEIHVRGSTIDHLEEADRLVFDLDPGPGIGWSELVTAARDVRKRLAQRKLKSFVKTSGGKGLHVVVPIRFIPWETAKLFSRRIAEEMAAEQPDRYTATLKKSAREQRIFVDYLRNSREATAIAPYSTRARTGAGVSTPLTWDELGSLKSASDYGLHNIPRRLARLRKDPWADIATLKQSIPDS